jgi:hypothetical protein
MTAKEMKKKSNSIQLSVKDALLFPISKRSVPNRLIKAALTESLADPNTSQPNDHHFTLYDK